MPSFKISREEPYATSSLTKLLAGSYGSIAAVRYWFRMLRRGPRLRLGCRLAGVMRTAATADLDAMRSVALNDREISHSFETCTTW